jgi:hypothetical protein
MELYAFIRNYIYKLRNAKWLGIHFVEVKRDIRRILRDSVCDFDSSRKFIGIVGTVNPE